MAKDDYSNWLSPGDYDKMIGQVRLQLNGIFSPFNMHGLDVFIPGAINECMIIVEQACKRVRGRDVPISIGKFVRE